MRRTLPGIGPAGMADIANADSVGFVLAGREREGSVSLERGILDVVRRERGGSLGVSRAVAALTQNASFMAAVVDELAEEPRIPAVGEAGVVGMAGEGRVHARALFEAGRQGRLLPGLVELARSDPLVQVAVAVRAPDRGLALVGADRKSTRLNSSHHSNS